MSLAHHFEYEPDQTEEKKPELTMLTGGKKDKGKITQEEQQRRFDEYKFILKKMESGDSLTPADFDILEKNKLAYRLYQEKLSKAEKIYNLKNELKISSTEAEQKFFNQSNNSQTDEPLPDLGTSIGRLFDKIGDKITPKGKDITLSLGDDDATWAGGGGGGPKSPKEKNGGFGRWLKRGLVALGLTGSVAGGIEGVKHYSHDTSGGKTTIIDTNSGTQPKPKKLPVLAETMPEDELDKFTETTAHVPTINKTDRDNNSVEAPEELEKETTYTVKSGDGFEKALKALSPKTDIHLLYNHKIKVELNGKTYDYDKFILHPNDQVTLKVSENGNLSFVVEKGVKESKNDYVKEKRHKGKGFVRQTKEQRKIVRDNAKTFPTIANQELPNINVNAIASFDLLTYLDDPHETGMQEKIKTELTPENKYELAKAYMARLEQADSDYKSNLEAIRFMAKKVEAGTANWDKDLVNEWASQLFNTLNQENAKLKKLLNLEKGWSPAIKESESYQLWQILTDWNSKQP